MGLKEDLTDIFEDLTGKTAAVKAEEVANAILEYSMPIGMTMALKLKYVTASTVLVQWDRLRIENIYWDKDDHAGAFSETVDITNSGLLGLDTGSEAVSTWYYVWAIAKDDGTASAILSIQYPNSGTDPTLPAGYTKKKCISAVYNNAASNFVSFKQQQQFYTLSTGIYVVTGGTASAYTEIDCTSVIPEMTHTVYFQSFNHGIAAGAGERYVEVMLKGYINGAYDFYVENYINGYAIAATDTPSSFQQGILKTFNRKFQYKGLKSSGTTLVTIIIHGFEVDI